MAHIDEWFASTADFKNRDECEPEHVLETLYTLLTFPEEVVKVLAQYRVHYNWDAGKVEVCSTALDDPNGVTDIKTAFLVAWKMITFSQGRWLRSGPSGSAFTGGEQLGMQSLVQFIREVKHGGDYYIKGYTFATQDVKAMFVMCAFSSRPSEAFQTIAIKDGRLIKRAGDIREAMALELDILHSITDRVVQLLAKPTNKTPTELRTMMVGCAETSVAFIEARVLVKTELLPWSLCDEPNTRLEALAAGDPPEEENAWKLYQLIHSGYPLDICVNIVNEMGDLDFTSGPSEKAHTHATVHHKFHPEAQSEAVRMHSHMGGVRPLVTDTETEKRLETFDNLFEKTLISATRALTGRNIFLRELFQVTNSVASTPELARETRKELMTVHAQRYYELPDEVRLTYETMARKETAEMRAARAAELDELVEAQDEVIRERTRAEVEDNPWSLKRCIWSTEDKQEFANFLKAPFWSQGKVEQRRKDRTEAPAIPRMEDKLHIGTQKLMRPRVESWPDWVDTLAHARDGFYDTVLEVSSEVVGDPPGFFRFDYAYQKPLDICFTKFRRDFTNRQVPLPGCIQTARRAFAPYVWKTLREYLFEPQDANLECN